MTRNKDTELAACKATYHLECLSLNKDDLQIIKHLFSFAYERKGVFPSDVDKRDRHVVEANTAISILIDKHFPFTLSLIGKIMRKHHATIIHYKKLHKNCLSYDKDHLRLIKNLDLIVDEMKKDKDEVKIDHLLLDSEKDKLIRELIKANASLKVTNHKLKDDLYNIKRA